MGNEWTRFALSESQAPEQSLTLTHTEFHGPVVPQPLSQRLTIPEIYCHATDPRRLAQNHPNLLKLRLREPCRSPGSFSLDQPGQAFRIKALDPIFDRARAIA